MKNKFARCFANVLLACGIGSLGFQSAHAQTLTTTVLPGVVSATARTGASFTVQVTNEGSTEVFGVVLLFSVPKGTKVALPGNCIILTKNNGAVQCVLGYIAPGSSADLDLTISSSKGGHYSIDFSAACTADACSGDRLTVPILLS